MNKKIDNRILGGLLFFIIIFAVLVYSFYAQVLIWGIIVGIGILGTSFWVWMLIDCTKNEPSEGNDKLIWVIIIVFTHLLGAAIYYFTRRPTRIEEVVR